ncbi:MAG: hypothetical protein JXQ76_02760 [Campylobacterales bacterium]|nr:hypothetical protein [Campylobacterales bacterium]
MDSYEQIEKKGRASRAKWLKECGGDNKYIHIEDNQIILNVGTQCKHTFTFDDIQSVGYRFRDDKNFLFIMMSKDSSTNRGDKTEVGFYNIFIYQDRYYESNDVLTLVKKFEKNNFTINGLPNKSTFLDKIKNYKTFFRPTFHGWHLGDKQMELEDEAYNKLQEFKRSYLETQKKENQCKNQNGQER